jgi:CDP-paratose 2-epimerase
MRILITGVCGFVGSALGHALADCGAGHQLFGLDNFSRPGSEGNRVELKRRGVRLFHADLRAASDVEALPAVDWVIDAAASPSVLAGVDGRTSSRQLVEHNLSGTVNLLEYCKHHHAGLILLSTSRVYSIAPLAALPVEVLDGGFHPARGQPLPPGISPAGISESFTTMAPVSLYGATKLASETLALEYGEAFGVPVFINRCGVMAGAGQFGRADQGIFAFWINSWLRRRPLKYIGFDGQGHQVRDCLHPADLLPLLERQLLGPRMAVMDRIINLGGGASSAMSLRQLSAWCTQRFGPMPVPADLTPRAFDLPWIVLDSAKAKRLWGWRARATMHDILDEIARHAEAHPEWLDSSAPL